MFDAPQGRMKEMDEAEGVALQDIDEDELVTTPGDDELVDPSVRTGEMRMMTTVPEDAEEVGPKDGDDDLVLVVSRVPMGIRNDIDDLE